MFKINSVTFNDDHIVVHYEKPRGQQKPPYTIHHLQLGQAGRKPEDSALVKKIKDEIAKIIIR